jgi:hypothetical protein
MDRELDMIARETTTESHEKEKQLEKYKEMLSRNLEEAERHLLEQKQSLEKQLMKKQIELQDIAQTLSRKKSHISEAVTILQVPYNNNEQTCHIVRKILNNNLN